jgi:hypothetical protein
LIIEGSSPSPAAVRTLNPDIPVELEAINKAIEKDKEQRYRAPGCVPTYKLKRGFESDIRRVHCCWRQREWQVPWA